MFFSPLPRCCMRPLFYRRSKIPFSLVARSEGEVLHLSKPLHVSRGSPWSITAYTRAVWYKIWAAHSNPHGAGTLSFWNSVSYSNICKIRALQVPWRLGSGSVWYRLEACTQLQLHLLLGATHSSRGNVCLGMSSCCCTAVLHISSLVVSRVCRSMNYPSADGWFHPSLCTCV